MMTKFMNKQRGLLAAIMALVMVFAGAAFVAAEVDATDEKISLNGEFPYYNDSSKTDKLVNAQLGAYDIKLNGNNYVVTGYAFPQIVDDTIDTVFESWWGDKDYVYGIIFDDGANQHLLYMNGKSDLTAKTITMGGVTYTFNLSAVKFLDAVTSNDFKTKAEAGGNLLVADDMTITLTDAISLLAADLLIYVADDAELTISAPTTVFTGTKKLTLCGEGEVVIKTTSKISTSTNYIASNFDAVAINAIPEVNISVKTTIDATSGDIGVGICGMGTSDALKINSAEVKITGSNRGIYVRDVDIGNGANVTASGYERGITFGGGSIDVTGVGTVLNAKLLSAGNVNKDGENDRMGLKIGQLKVGAGATVKADGAHIGVSAEIEGTLDVAYNSGAGRAVEMNQAGNEIVKSAIPAGLILVEDENKPAKVSTLTIKGAGIVKVTSGNAIIGNIVGDGDIDGTASFGNIDNTTKKLNAVLADSDVTFKAGSIIMNGKVVEVTENTTSVILSGNVVLSGEINVPITVNDDANITVPAAGLVLNKDMSFGTGCSMNVIGDISGSAEIKATGSVDVDKSETAVISVKNSNLSIEESGVENVPTSNTDKVIDSKEEAEKFSQELLEYTKYTIDGDLNISGNVSVTIPANVTLYVEDITVGTKSTGTSGNSELIVHGYIIGSGTLMVYDNLYLDGADVRMTVSVDEDSGYVSIVNAKEMTVKGDSTADLDVGFGNTLVLSDLRVYGGKSINAYGTIIIEGTVTVEKNAQFNVYAGGNAQIDGALVIEGIANIDGAADVNGSVKVYNANGNAAFNVAAGADVDIAGTMDVLVGKNKAQNTLAIKTAPENKMNFVVTGTLNITGTLDGAVYDMGTVAFNGTAVGSNAKIFIFDGMTITIASVNGQLTVEDKIDITDFITNEKASDSNNVVLKNVKNVTISTEVTETVKENASKQKIRYYTLNMTVSGAVTSIDDTVTTANYANISINNAGASAGWADAKVDDRSITIGDITAGKKVGVNIAAVKATVAGTITIAAEGSKIVNSSTVAVDVDGAIVIVDKEAKKTDCTIGLLNAAAYEVEDKTGTAPFDTYYYTTFEAALAASADDSDKTIDVFGTSKIASDLEVPAEITVNLATGAAMTIDVDGKLTVAATALLDASAGSVKVDGMLVIMDKDTGLNGESKLTYQVLNETETTATYSGLVLALQNAVAGDVITLKQNADITKSVTIPEGVTLVVPKNVTLTIGDDKDNVTLTVAGTLKVDGTVVNGSGASVDSEIEVPGVIIKTGTLGVMPEDYVEFTMKIDGRLTTVYSNLAYAAANAVDGDVKVYGDISGGDVTFTVADKKTLTITVTNDSTLSVGTLTLVGAGASITTTPAVGASGSTPAKEAGVITGTIATAAGSVDLNKVSGITFTVSVETTVDASTDVVTIAGTPVGSFEVATGIITAAEGFEMNATKDNKMSVASGATLLIKKAFTATGIVNGDNLYDVVVDGTISVIEGGNVTITYTTVNGTIDVASKGILNIASATVNGTISVAEKTDDADAGKAYVNGALVLGAAPALGANGAFVGPVDIKNNANAFIIAYAGADVSAALIDVENGESTVKSTEIILNGVPYMTVYVDKGNTTTDLEALQDYLEVEGYETEIEWADPASKDTVIGSIEKVEGTLTAAKTKLTVSAGVGLKVYIDGLAIENFYGKYDVNGTATPDDDVTGYWIQFGTHTVSFAVESGYDGANATITVNGVAVSNNGTFTVDVDDKDVVIIASGAVPAQSSGSTVIVDGADDGMALTDILLIVLVVLIVIMAIIVALRMMRS